MQAKLVYEKFELTLWRLLIPLMDKIRIYTPIIHRYIDTAKSILTTNPYYTIIVIALSGLIVGFLSAIIAGLT